MEKNKKNPAEVGQLHWPGWHHALEACHPPCCCPVEASVLQLEPHGGHLGPMQPTSSPGRQGLCHLHCISTGDSGVNIQAMLGGGAPASPSLPPTLRPQMGGNCRATSECKGGWAKTWPREGELWMFGGELAVCDVGGPPSRSAWGSPSCRKCHVPETPRSQANWASCHPIS